MNSADQTTLVESIGDFLLKKCMISGTSVKEISSRTGLTEQAIGRLESGRSRRVDRVKITALSEHLGFSIYELVVVTNPRHPEPYAEGRANKKT